MNQENQEQDDLIPGNCDTGIPRYLIDNFPKPLVTDDPFNSGCVEVIKNFPIKLHTFGKKIWENLDTNYFSESKMIIPPNFKLVTDAFKVGTTLAPSKLVSADIITMKNNSKQISPNRVFMSFIHSINDEVSIVHPCTKSTLGESQKAHVGLKVCAYPLFTASLDITDLKLKETHLLFYAEHPEDGEVANKLLELYLKYNATPPTPTTPRPGGWYLNATKLENWSKVFIIPLMTPNAGVIFKVIADTIEGRAYLLNWLNSVKIGKWIPVDVIKESVEEWEADITLDARVN